MTDHTNEFGWPWYAVCAAAWFAVVMLALWAVTSEVEAMF